MTTITRSTSKRKTPIKRCHLSPEARATQLLKEFKRERFFCCEVCLKSKTKPSMEIFDVMWAEGWPRWPYAICARCAHRAHSLGIEQGTLQRAYEHKLRQQWRGVWG